MMCPCKTQCGTGILASANKVDPCSCCDCNMSGHCSSAVDADGGPFARSTPHRNRDLLSRAVMSGGVLSCPGPASLHRPPRNFQSRLDDSSLEPAAAAAAARTAAKHASAAAPATAAAFASATTASPPDQRPPLPIRCFGLCNHPHLCFPFATWTGRKTGRQTNLDTDLRNSQFHSSWSLLFLLLLPLSRRPQLEPPTTAQPSRPRAPSVCAPATRPDQVQLLLAEPLTLLRPSSHPPILRPVATRRPPSLRLDHSQLGARAIPSPSTPQWPTTPHPWARTPGSA